jgi:PAS domain S-box-containing protein
LLAGLALGGWAGARLRSRRAPTAGNLGAAERRLEAILAHLDEAVTVQDATGRTVYANPAAAALLGFASPQALLREPPGSVFDRFEVTEEDGTPVPLKRLPSYRILRGEPAAPLLVRNAVRETGEERWLIQRATPVRDDDGALAYVVNVIENVTEAKQAEHAQRLLAEASRLLTSGDPAAAVRDVAALLVPRLAEECEPELAAPGKGSPPDTRLERDGAASRLAVPLRAGSRSFGTLTLRSERPHAFDPAVVALAEELGRRVGAALEQAHLHREREEIAHTLQAGLMPVNLPVIPRWRSASLYRAAGEANEVGGDFYDAFAVPSGWAVIVGDVAGKGARAASLTAQARHTLHTAMRLRDRLVEAFAELNASLAADPELLLCTAVGMRLADDWARIVSAGHPPPILVRRGEARPVGKGGPLLGAYADVEWPEVELDLEAGDTFVLYTDGVLDSAGPGGERFGEARLLATLAAAPADAAGAVAAVGSALDGWAEGPPRDDIAVIAVRWEGMLRAGGKLPRDSGSPAAARLILRRALDGRLDPDVLDRALVIASELVTNAVRHGGPGPVRVDAALGTSRLRVEVRDRGAGFTPAPPASGRDGGFGLVLVRETADRWGIESDGGTCVWVELDVHRPPPRGR